MVRTQSTLAENESVDTAYPSEIRVVRVDREDEPPLYRFEAPMHEPKDSDVQPVWENPAKARMYAAVYVACNGFREEKTGRRGVPIEVAKYGREAVVAYLSTVDGSSTRWLSRMFDLDEQRIYEYRSRIKNAAEEQAAKADNAGKSEER